jgi:hypothetical protein
MSRQRNLPLLIAFGRIARYAAAGYFIFGVTSAVLWVVFQFFASRTELTVAASIFFAGFSLLIVLVVVGVAVITITIEAMVIAESDRIVQAITDAQRIETESIHRLFGQPRDGGDG